MSLENLFKTPADSLTPDQVAEVLEVADDIIGWLEAVKEGALSDIVAGKPIPGWKAVPGITRQKWADEAKAEAYLSSKGYDRSFYTKESLLSPSALSKALGKALSDDMKAKGMIIKPEGEPKLARDDDKREPVCEADAFDAKIRETKEAK